MNSPNPPTPAYSDPLEWITAYLTIHMMSPDSFRYTYYLWYIIAAFFILSSLLHHLPIFSTYPGKWWNKWSWRRRTWRRKSWFRISQRKGPAGYPTSLPTNGQILAFAVLLLICIFLCFAGPDYIRPPAPPAIARRAYSIGPYIGFQPNYTINKAWWTAGGRTGLIAFALYPLCVLFILKVPPFAIFALPLTARFFYDRLSYLHRWTGWLIWSITALHAIFWSIQLAKDKRTDTTTVAYTYAWQYTKFVYGWIAFGFLTLLMAASIRPIRRHYYEAFYFLHILLVPLTLIMSALHHPPVWWWCWAAFALWAGERLWRGLWWLHVNGYMGATSETPASAAPGSKKSAQNYFPPPGYARAELMAGATLRITYIPPGFISWAPGQSFLISIPSVSRLTSHPFTVASLCDEQEASDAGRAMVFYIRAKAGWTNKLWDHITDILSCEMNHDPMEDPPNVESVPHGSVLLRMWVEGPHGSAETIDWKRHSSVVIIAGGVGVSYGAAALHYLCHCMAGRDGKYLGGQSGTVGNGFMVQRVRFVWILREFAHIQWCSDILRSCLSMVPPYSLQIDIFVTNFTRPAQLEVAPPTPSSDIEADVATIRLHSKRNTAHTGLSPTTRTSFTESADMSDYTGWGDEEDGNEDYTLDLTNFDGDREMSLYGEELLSLRVLKAGKHKRESTRRSMLAVHHARRQLDVAAHSIGRPPAAIPASHERSADTRRRPSHKRQDTDPSTPSASSASPRPYKLPPTSPIQPTPERNNSKRSDFTFVERVSEPAVPSSVKRTWHRSQRPTIQTSLPSSGNRGLAPPGMESTPSLAPSWDSSSASTTHAFVASAANGAEVRIELSRKELQDVGVISEYARPGKPRLEKILADEVTQCQGSLLVTCCGPTSLDAKVRNAVSNLIQPRRVAIDLASEDFSY